jgi:hypothetical protein
VDQHTIGQIRQGSPRARFAGMFLVLLLAAVMAGCSSDDTATGGGGATATTSAASPASTVPVTTRATTSEPVVLADGRHPVLIKTVDAQGRRITFDLIQFLTGEAAIKAAAEDHQESPPPNDYYIRNVNPRLRTLPVRSGAPITVNNLAYQESGNSTKNVTVTLAKLASLMPKQGGPPIWITVQNGQVTKIAEQFVP